MLNLLKQYKTQANIETTYNIARLISGCTKCDTYYGHQLSIIRREYPILPSPEKHREHGEIISAKLQTDENTDFYIVYCMQP